MPETFKRKYFWTFSITGNQSDDCDFIYCTLQIRFIRSSTNYAIHGELD